MTGLMKELLSHAHVGLPMFALVVFALVFTGVIIRTYGKKSSAYAEVERLPLDDDDEPRVGADGGRRG
jgi:cbb3-type cytochrome oxidase subunit 3